MEMPLSPEAQRDQRTQFHPFTSITDLMAEGPTVMVSGKGVRVRDDGGKEYLDGMAGLWCVNLGYGRREIVDAIAGQSERLSFFHTFNGMTTDGSVKRTAHFKKSPTSMFDAFPHLGNSIRTRQRRMIAPGISDVVHEICDFRVIELPIECRHRESG